METKTTISDKIMNGLHKAIAEVEELQVQASLGKAEAKDLFHESKKKFNDFIQRTKSGVNSSQNKFKESGIKVKAVLGEIEKSLAKAKTETKEAFIHEKDGLNELLNSLETTVADAANDNKISAEIKHEVEKFKLKMELLKLQFEMKQLDSKQDLELKKKKYSAKMDELKSNLILVKDSSLQNWNSLQNELNKAYADLKKTILE